jgi:hypothetical protein
MSEIEGQETQLGDTCVEAQNMPGFGIRPATCGLLLYDLRQL